jgi:hypothetical protein
MNPRHLLLIVGLVGVMGVVAVGARIMQKPTPQMSNHPSLQTDASGFYRSYTGTAQVMGVKAISGGRCRIDVKFHSWLSITQGFPLAEIPQKGQRYQIVGEADQCLAVEVALASQGNPNDLESPRHIAYKAGQTPSGEWRLSGTPKAPVGCNGL